MTGNTNKTRAVILAALMVFSVFAGTVAFAGSASAQQASQDYVGGAVHYENVSGSEVIEVPFDGPIENESIDANNFTVLDDGENVSSQIDYATSASSHDGSGNVQLILQGSPDASLINSNDLEVDLSGDVANSPGEKAVAFASQTVDVAGGTPSSNVTAYQGATVVFEDTSADNDSAITGFDIEDDEDSFDYFQSFSAGENSTVFYFNTGDRELGDYELNNSDNYLTVRDLGLDVSIDDTNVSIGDDIEGTVSARASNQNIEVELVDDGGDGDVVADIGTQTSGQGEYDFNFPTSNRDAGDYTVQVTDNSSGVEVESSTITLEETDDDAEFTDNTISQQRGDIVEMTVEMEGSSYATITVGEVDGSEGVVANATVEDENDDGQVTVYLNTYDLEENTGSNEPFAVDDDSDDSVTEQDISTYTQDLIDAGEYDVEVAAGQTEPADADGGSDGVATLVLEERSTDNLRMWTGSKEEISPSDLEDVNEALANNEITQSSEVAVGDYAVHQIEASGFEGLLDARQNEEVTTRFLNETDNPIRLTIEEASPGANQDAETLSLANANTTVVADGANDTYFVIVNTENVELTDGTAKSALPSDDDTALETNFTVVQDDLGFDFTPDDQYDDDENEETFLTWNANEPEVTIDTPYNVSASSGQTVSGTTNIAPGTEMNLRVRSQDGVSPSFLKTASPVVQPDGSFSAEFDFSSQNVGDEYDIVVNSNILASAEEESGTVVEAVETDTATPEPDTDTPEPDTDTPEPDTDTPEPDTDTPMPDTDTPEPDTETPTSTPGFGVVVALTALLAAALLAIRRD